MIGLLVWGKRRWSQLFSGRPIAISARLPQICGDVLEECKCCRYHFEVAATWVAKTFVLPVFDASVNSFALCDYQQALCKDFSPYAI